MFGFLKSKTKRGKQSSGLFKAHKRAVAKRSIEKRGRKDAKRHAKRKGLPF